MVEAKEVVVLEIRFLDNNSQMTHSNDSHTEEVEEASLKAGGAKEDMAIGTKNNLDQILEIVIIVANQAIGPENVGKKKDNDMRNGRLQQNNYASSSKQAEDRYEHLFVV
jgi:hypothetical protein